MTISPLQTGSKGENIASEFLQEKGYRVLERNFRCRMGEIDLIAEKDGTIAFIEVKSRTGESKGKPYEAVTGHKIARIMRVGEMYILQKKQKKYKLSVHVVSIVFESSGKVGSFKHFENITL